jgi:hypothetical protein
MRNFISGLLLIIVAGMMSGCVSNTEKKSVGSSDMKTSCVMRSGGANVLRLTVASDVKCEARDGSLDLNSPHLEMEVWLVREAQTIDDAIARAGDVIPDQFKNFKTESASDVTIAGAPAKRLIGTGKEADDGDDGKADLIVFKVADHIFIAATHGEDLNSAAQQWMLTVVQSARTP